MVRFCENCNRWFEIVYEGDCCPRCGKPEDGYEYLEGDLVDNLNDYLDTIDDYVKELSRRNNQSNQGGI